MSVINIDKAVELLKAGTPVALPTETVYGLAAPIDQPLALAKIFEIKKRPLSDPLIVHISSPKMAENLFVDFNDDIKKLADHFWPGPLTLVAKKNKDVVSGVITSGFDTVAVRMPNSKIFREIIEQVGSPLAAPSANLFKKVSPTRAQHILATLPGVHVVDGGPCDVGIESTIYDVANKQILRPGDITHSQIEKVLNIKVTYTEKDFTPGSEKEHYRPKVPVFVFESKKDLHQELTRKSSSMEMKLNQDPKLAARAFYSDLRKCDEQNCSQILIHFDPSWTGTDWNALKNRLSKTSSRWNTKNEN